jgi:hypothetical protein
MFRTQPILRVLDPDRWVLERPLLWETTDEIIVIPPGFTTDLASVPRLAQPIFPVNDRHRAASILHDYIYVIQDRARAAADGLFLDAMAMSGVRWVSRRTIWLAVRLGAWLTWETYAQARERDLTGFLGEHGIRKP